MLQNPKQAVNQTVSFPGLSLGLSSISANSGGSLQDQGGGVADWLKGVGVVSSSFCPTHLQLLQVVEMEDIERAWPREPARQRVEMFKRWKKGASQATYR